MLGLNGAARLSPVVIVLGLAGCFGDPGGGVTNAQYPLNGTPQHVFTEPVGYHPQILASALPIQRIEATQQASASAAGSAPDAPRPTAVILKPRLQRASWDRTIAPPPSVAEPQSNPAAASSIAAPSALPADDTGVRAISAARRATP